MNFELQKYILLFLAFKKKKRRTKIVDKKRIQNMGSLEENQAYDEPGWPFDNPLRSTPPLMSG
jgi:hypothetical protein